LTSNTANLAVRELYLLSQSVLIFTTARAYAVVYKRHFSVTATNFAAGFRVSRTASPDFSTVIIMIIPSV